jgi:hypothetical protein
MNDLEKETMRTLEEQVAVLSKLVRQLAVYNGKLTDQIVVMSNELLGINVKEETEDTADIQA